MTRFPLSADQTPFADLPVTLVDDVLGQTSTVARELLSSFRGIREERTTLRAALADSGIKPQEWLPALRVEVSASVATNTHRLATVVQGIKHQTATPSMLEPYPIYLADRTVKALARAVPAFRQVTTQRISEQYEGDIGEVFFAMHGYRSEAGR